MSQIPISLAIEVKQLSKRFNDNQVLSDVTVSWERGKIHGLVGRNGSGKTVLLKCICGLMAADKGDILVDGKRIGSDIEMPPSIGVILEHPGFIQRYSGFKNLVFLASIRRVISKEQILQCMIRVGLDPHNKKPVKHYSMGMKQRLGIAQAIMEKPNILILDEPFNGLDKQGANEIGDLLKSLKEVGNTIIIVSHNPADIDKLCDTVHEIDAGHIAPIIC